MGHRCYFCQEDGATVHVDYTTATGRQKLPGLNSKNFDDRYGFMAHSECLRKREERIAKKAKQAGIKADLARGGITVDFVEPDSGRKDKE